MAIDKLLPGHETVVLIPAIEVNGVPHLVGDTLVPLNLPTSAVINEWLTVTSNGSTGSGAGGNISCALRDDLTLGLTDSDSDSDRTICSVGQSEELTFYNFDAEFNIFRNENPTDATSQFVMASDLVRAPDIPYIIAHRIGYESDELAAEDQEWDFYYAWTDNPVDAYSDGGNLIRTQTMVPKNLVNIAHILTA